MSKDNMPKEKMVYFRTSLGGFNREDVNSYIEKLNGEFAERERTAKRKTDALESKLAELENAKSELERALARASALETAAAEREKLIAEQLARIEEQNRTIDALRRERGEAQSRAESLDERLASLSDAIAKSEKYDDVSAQIGEIILSAKSTADEIIEAAKREADDMRRTADEQLESAAASFNARAATAAYAVKSQIKKIANDSYSALTAQTEQTAALLHALAENIGKSSAELDDRLASGKSDAEAAIGAEAAKIFGDENRIKFNF